ncbi:MAG: TatD family hydrolase [Bacteroidota bacterium]
MYIDSHAHLFLENYGSDLDEVLDRSVRNGIQAIVIPGTNLKTSAEAADLAHRFPFLHACVGVHPHEASAVTDEDLSAIEDLSASPGIVAIGEIGLDYHYDFAPRERQREIFRNQISLAAKRNLPIVVHTRESMADAMDIVAASVRELPQWRPGAIGCPSRGVFHCFTGTAEEAQTLFSLGFYVSFPGIVTFKNSSVRATLREIGSDRIMLETDSPYLTPVPHRGKRNEPSYLPLIASAVADILETTPDHIAATTTKNAINLFAITTHVRATQHI